MNNIHVKADPNHFTPATNWFAVFLYADKKDYKLVFNRLIGWVAADITTDISKDQPHRTMSGVYQAEDGLAFEYPEENPAFRGYFHKDDIRCVKEAFALKYGSSKECKFVNDDIRILMETIPS